MVQTALSLTPPTAYPTAPAAADPQPLADWPLDLRRDAFASPAGLPWLPDSCVPFAAAATHGYAVGDPVRLLALPPALAAMPRPARRRLGKLLGELFEVVALPLPDQLAIARHTRLRGEPAFQVLYVSADCVERALFAAAAE